jgi:hypothetical protein
MIFQSYPPASPWTRGAIIFFIFNSLSIFSVWMVFDIAEKPQNSTGPIWLGVAGVSFGLYLLGVFSPVPRLRYAILILGVFVALPGLVFFTVPLFLFMELAKIESGIKLSVFSVYVSLMCAWCTFQAKKIIALERKYDYLRSNFILRRSIGFFYPYAADVLGHGEASTNLTRGKILSIITPITFLGYPMQRLIADAGGAVGVFGVITVLSLPLAVYIAGKISAGYFLWVHLVGNFEKENNVKIFLR